MTSNCPTPPITLSTQSCGLRSCMSSCYIIVSLGLFIGLMIAYILLNRKYEELSRKKVKTIEPLCLCKGATGNSVYVDRDKVPQQQKNTQFTMVGASRRNY